jgi:hypothetical protein
MVFNSNRAFQRKIQVKTFLSRTEERQIIRDVISSRIGVPAGRSSGVDLSARS